MGRLYRWDLRAEQRVVGGGANDWLDRTLAAGIPRAIETTAPAPPT